MKNKSRCVIQIQHLAFCIIFLWFLPMRVLGKDTVYVSNVRFEAVDRQVIIWYDLHYHKDDADALKKMLASLNVQDRKADPRTSRRSAAVPGSEEHRESDANDEEFKVTITLRKDSDEFFRYLPRKVSGDVGIVLSPGRDKKIVWDMAREFQEGLDGVDFYFEVRTEVIRQEDMTMWWFGGGAAVLGLTTYLLLTGGKGQTIESGEFPPPPGRPR